jgi:hypothetical protein
LVVGEIGTEEGEGVACEEGGWNRGWGDERAELLSTPLSELSQLRGRKPRTPEMSRTTSKERFWGRVNLFRASEGFPQTKRI